MIFAAGHETKQRLYDLFNGMTDTTILSCLQGHMGSAWVDNAENPAAAQIIVGDFVFFAGDAQIPEADEMLANINRPSILITNASEWKAKIESAYKDSFELVQRYQFDKNPSDLNVEHLQTFLSALPAAYKLRKLDHLLVREPSLHRISKDFTGQFSSLDDFVNRGIGYCILYEGEIVCAASSYSIYDDGIEIEIGTDPAHRQKGLATVTAAALLIDCLQNGLYPSWDAANLHSVKLAKKLGYAFCQEYDAYMVPAPNESDN